MSLKAELTYDDATRRWTIRVVEPAAGGMYSGEMPEIVMRHLVDQAIEHGVAQPFRDRRPRRTRALIQALDVLDHPAHWVERLVAWAIPYREDDPIRPRRAVADWAQWATYKLCPYSHTWAQRLIDDSPRWLATSEYWEYPDDETEE